MRELVKIFWYPALILLVSELIINPFRLFELFWWLDEFLHFFGGMAVAISASLLLRRAHALGLYSADRRISIFFVVCFVALVAVVWEWHEFVRDFLFSQNSQLSMFDTMKDLFLGVLGACIISPFVVKR
ncbi:hypothetical protein D6825_00885 [Candidatus Woesearchaeota archaeon]|nr:MAG: hypothetical protein D6825_00885 [Candidatus Woesearchaeota archaeon]